MRLDSINRHRCWILDIGRSWRSEIDNGVFPMPATLSNRVKSLQQALVTAGHAIQVDGVMGVETYYAAVHAQNGTAAKGDDAQRKKTPENGSDSSTIRLIPEFIQKSRLIDLIVVHSSATTPSQDIGVREIREWHLARGFRDVGYHYAIKRNGALEFGRKEREPGAHVKGHNARSIGICMVGGARLRNGNLVADNNFTMKQWSTLGQALRELKEKYPDAEIKGHRDLAATACPSFDVQTWVKEFL